MGREDDEVEDVKRAYAERVGDDHNYPIRNTPNRASRSSLLKRLRRIVSKHLRCG